MQSLQKGFIAYVIVAVLAIILIGGSFYFNSRNKTGSLSDNQLLLLGANQKVEMETAKLEELHRRYQAERKIVAQIQEEYSNIKTNILRRTDIFFKNAESKNPQIIIKISNKNIEKDINNRRLEITKLLEAWDKENEIINSDSVSINLLPTLSDLVKSAKKDISYIEKYIAQLESIINNLSIENSDLTQSQISSYQFIIASNINEVEKVVSTFTTIENSANEIYAANAETTTVSIVAISSPGEEASTPSPTTLDSTETDTTAPTPLSMSTTPPIVTLSQIEAQEEVVVEAEVEQAEIEQMINQPVEITIEVPMAPTVIVYPENLPAQGIIQYLPNPFADHTGWPDLTVDEISGKPLLLDGANK
ncbi:MAG: hypothetical protein A3H52_03275 [Candidatus Zambryskibacteria bacterium RIFCSPLOWO2_02_FULL_39_26]|uniref:Uncharacterized protein n=1 Tax=Candidatus Zambryskibacteria bacterium RIFCSPLOWO2_12_FULL_39_23 TaxID=1802776 RepID=A0A1G2UU08_9BACT|nr:MAG: hypothetical protein A3H52_03275 [Candidatus Zambryskibacteria bacterium RIFCSPLOWO2_02_FULL_39_26]OHB12865.1 MAG: hypothetical protein A3G99_02235 [Candidatus Zambryskibacteria bacterium RIFCSPLOWO2_12_FULL_39_23]